MNKPNLLQRFRNESSRTRSATEPGWRSVYSMTFATTVAWSTEVDRMPWLRRTYRRLVHDDSR